MGLEIERKFLVSNDTWRGAVTRTLTMRQGYLASSARASVRVRAAGERAWLNIKEARLGSVRREYEYSIDAAEAAELLDQLCAPPLIEKTRNWLVAEAPSAVPLEWEVDEFHGANAGLVVAEIELADPQQPFARPPWLGREVTHLARYYNVNLCGYPFRHWSDAEKQGD